MTKEDRQEMIDGYSDYHKDARGFRPSFDISSLSDSELQADYDMFAVELDDILKANEAREAQGIIDFEKIVGDVQGYCSCTRSKAVKFLMDAENDGGYSDNGYFEYLNHLPYGYIKKAVA